MCLRYDADPLLLFESLKPICFLNDSVKRSYGFCISDLVRGIPMSRLTRGEIKIKFCIKPYTLDDTQ